MRMILVDTHLLRASFPNPVNQDVIEEYAVRLLMGEDPPPIKGYPRTIDEDDIGDTFLDGTEITREDIGDVAWYVTDGYHRCYAAIEAGMQTIMLEEDDD